MRPSSPLRKDWLLLISALALVVVTLLALTPTPVEAQACAGSLPPRLTIGGSGFIAERFSTLRSSPGGAAIRIVNSPATFTVVSGPVCAGNLLYWEIDYGGGVRGWALESQVVSIYGVNRYWLAPGRPATPTPTIVPPTATPSAPDCSASLPTRLTVGGTGRIAERFSTLRSAPGGAAIRVIYSPATFTVVSGPVCVRGLAYWEIDYGGGVRGWALESQRVSIYGSNKYWLAP